jgi:broad specificity phosphatase PhoE
LRSDGGRPHELVLARHGETEWSKSGRHTGRTDIPLTDEGRVQAELLGTSLAGIQFECVYTSPLSRAVDTCRLAGFEGAAKVRDELLEWDYGEYEGRTTQEIRAERPGWLLWRDGNPGGETAADVGARVDRLLSDLEDVEGAVALFAHGHVLRALAARWLGLGPENGALLRLDTATVSLLGWERELAVLRRWNVPPGLPVS